MARRKFFGFLTVVVLTVVGTNVMAQGVPQDLERLQRDLQDLQRFVYGQRNSQPSDAVNTPPSTQGGPEFNARIQRSVQALQSQVRNLTGQYEEVQFNLRRIQERLDKLVGDIDLRLRNLEQSSNGQPRVAQGDASPVSPIAPVAGQPVSPAAPVAANGTTVITSTGVVGAVPSSNLGAPAGGDRTQGTLGTIGQSDIDAVRQGRAQDIQPAPRSVQNQVANQAPRPIPAQAPAPRAAPVQRGIVSQTGVTQSAAAQQSLPPGTPQEQYQFAFSLLKQREYEKAAAMLRQFVDRYPENPLSGNAMYWMGETYYVQKDFAEAARIFLDGFQRFPTGNKAPDNLLKLAKSLVEVGETKSACAAYGKLLKTFPNGNARLLTTAKSEVSRLQCS